MADEKIYCDICGCETDDYKEVDGDIVCADCLEENYVICNDCGAIIPNNEAVETGDGELVCEECIASNYVYCDECENYHRHEDTTYLENYEITVCDSCLDNNFSRCEGCGEWVSDDERYTTDGGDIYCEDCYYDRYTTCDDCGCELYRDDAICIDGCNYCDSCAEEHEEEPDYDNIYDYHAFNHYNYIPRYSKGEDSSDSSISLYGLELEVGGYCSKASEIVDRLQGNAIAMHDSSVDGFELVFMPITRKYLYNELRPVLEDALKFMINNDFKGHNAGGIHIHFTKIPNSMQVANMTRIIYGDEKDRKIWLKITQRRPENMHWCSMTSDVYDTDYILNNNIYAPAGTGNHGTALNFCTRTNTHELRIFNSNLRIERVLKNFECVFALQDYIAKASEPICDTRGFIDFVDKHAEDYPHLVAFLHEKRVFEIANRFYGDTYTSTPNSETVNSEVTNNETIEDGNEVTTDEEIRELEMSVA